MTEADRDFLIDLYADTREREMAQVAWTDEEKRAFIEMQYRAQDSYYREHYPDCEFTLLLLDGEPAGRLYVHRRVDEFRVVDIALLAKHRGRGIGGDLMREVLAEAASRGVPVRIHVEQDNPARKLYDRLGFVKIGESGVYYLLEKAI